VIQRTENKTTNTWRHDIAVQGAQTGPVRSLYAVYRAVCVLFLSIATSGTGGAGGPS